MEVEKVILWLDILGFKEFLLDEERSFREWPKIERQILKNLKSLSKYMKEHGVKIDFFIISDTLIVYAEELNSSSIICILLASILLQSSFHSFGFLSRGVVTVGKILVSRRGSKINTIIGYPIVEAALYESSMDFPLVVLGPSLVEKIFSVPELLNGSLTSLPSPFNTWSPKDLMLAVNVNFRSMGDGNTAVVFHPEFYALSLNSYLDQFLRNICTGCISSESTFSAINKLEKLLLIVEKLSTLDSFKYLENTLSALKEIISK